MTPTIAIISGGPSGLTLARLLECNNIDYVVYERNISENSPPGQGGSLDIHGATGQEALRRGGLSTEFEKLARRDATVAQVTDKTGKQHVKFGEGRDAPEIDRVQLRKLLLDSIPPHRIQWKKAVKQVERDGEGNVVVHFADGTNATGFQLVVGADGAWSKVRHLLTSTKPEYSSKSYIEGKITPGNPLYGQVEARVSHGSILAFGSRKHLAVQQIGDSSYRIYLGLTIDKNTFAPSNPNINLIANNGALARHWEHAPQVTLIGDAAHVSTPFVREGVNCAIYDALVLLEKILKFRTSDGLDITVAEYEKDIFKRSRDLIERSIGSAELLFAEDAPNGLVQIIQGSSE